MRKKRYRAVLLGNRNGTFYCKDTLTGSRTSLKTTDRQEADLLVQHKNEAIKNAHINRKIGMAYLSTSDPLLAKRVWQDVMDDIVKDKHGPTLHRWKTAIKDSAFDPIRKQAVVTTTADDFMGVLRKGTISTNVFLRRLHNHCIDMGWLSLTILPKKKFPKIHHKDQRAITPEEHSRIVASVSGSERIIDYSVKSE